MLKVALVVLVLIGFLWAHGPTRNRIAVAAEPVLVKLGPVGQVAQRPIRRWNAQTEVTFIAKQIELAAELGRDKPRQSNFRDWVRQRVKTRNAGNDPWGLPYYYAPGSDKSFKVGSAGADGLRNTEDDIVATGTY